MSVERFHLRCDGCGLTGPEYAEMPRCRDCGADTCMDCAEPDTLSDHDGDERVTCRFCARARRHHTPTQPTAQETTR